MSFYGGASTKAAQKHIYIYIYIYGLGPGPGELTAFLTPPAPEQVSPIKKLEMAENLEG